MRGSAWGSVDKSCWSTTAYITGIDNRVSSFRTVGLSHRIEARKIWDWVDQKASEVSFTTDWPTKIKWRSDRLSCQAKGASDLERPSDKHVRTAEGPLLSMRKKREVPRGQSHEENYHTFSERLAWLCAHLRCQYINPCSTPASKEDRARLFSVHSGPQSNRQWPQTEIMPGLLKCKENIFYYKGNSEIRWLKERCPSLNLSKTQLDQVLSSLL